MATLHFISQAQQAGQPVVITSWVELGGLVAIFTVVGWVVGSYRTTRCHHMACRREWRGRRLPLRRRGRFPHGHLKLCHVHHPHVPSHGQIDGEHIAAVTRSLGASHRS